MTTEELKQNLLNGINEKCKEKLICEEIKTLCEAWKIIAGQENMDKLSEVAPLFPFSPTIDN